MLIFSKSEAREKIKKLIEKYERLKKARQIRNYDEANTRKDFIMPLFKVLGWDVYNEFTDREVVEEETAVKGRVDYSFCINNIPQFLLEAKALKVNLDKIEWAKQAVTYGWNKGISWVVLTDFESLKLFNSEWLVETPHPNLEFTYNEFLRRLDDLWFLSRESIEKGELDKQAEKWGIKAKRLKVSEKLAEDLLKWRELLRKYFSQYNPQVSDEDIDESVQRVLDRLIFIRVCENRHLEPPTLWPALQTWVTHHRKPDNFIQALRPIFKDFDEKYNSTLFLEHLCEKLDTEGTPFEQIINDLYANKERGVKYNFSAIPADVLGTIYEQYLGYIQEKGVVNGVKRKRQGIYYTPEFIVDYIVQNTLGVDLKERTLRGAENIKVLDLACGSGSFLIKAFDALEKYLKEEKAQEKSGPIAAFRKYNILRNNIYGVDLDPQAIEITRLNLLLRALVPNHKLPLLSDNTKVGNSLVSGATQELKKYFGKNWREKRPFNWQEEFLEVFGHGGFDVIIGNPPYVRVDILSEDEKSFWKDIFESTKGKYDLYYLFIENALRLLKSGGKLGFIVPNKFCAASSAKRLREIIFNSSSFCTIVSVSNLEVFKDAANYPLILLLTKGKPLAKIGVSAARDLESFLAGKMSSYALNREDLSYLPLGVIPINIDQQQYDLTIKLTKQSDNFSQYVRISEALRIPESFESTEADDFEVLKQYQFDRYTPIKRGSYISKTNLGKVTGFKSNRFLNSLKEKIVIAEDALRITSTLDNKGRIPQGGVYFAVLVNNRIPIKVLLALLNSRLLSFVYKCLFGGMHMGGGYLRYRTEFLEQLPMPKIDLLNNPLKLKYKALIDSVDRMIELHEDLQKCAKDSDGYRVIQTEIEKVDKQIDQLVYKLYGLTPEEIQSVENLTKTKNA